MAHGNLRDLTGRQFNYWSVIERAPNKGRRTAYVARCVCGATGVVAACHLVSGRSKSCGCQRPRGEENPRFKHGASSKNNDIYRIWMQMRDRCRNTNLRSAPIYALKGIRVCPEWDRDFKAFADYMGPRPSKRHSVDRIDGSKGYEPGNVRWATPKEQGRNTSRNRIVTYRGRKMCLAEAAELAGVDYGAAKWRLNHGYPIDQQHPRWRRQCDGR